MANNDDLPTQYGTRLPDDLADQVEEYRQNQPEGEITKAEALRRLLGERFEWESGPSRLEHLTARLSEVCTLLGAVLVAMVFSTRLGVFLGRLEPEAAELATTALVGFGPTLVLLIGAAELALWTGFLDRIGTSRGLEPEPSSS
jgi:hypothetical protein